MVDNGFNPNGKYVMRSRALVSAANTGPREVRALTLAPPEDKRMTEDERRPPRGQMAHQLLNPWKFMREFIAGTSFTDLVVERFRSKAGADYQTPLGPYREILDSDPVVQACLKQRHADILERDRLLQPADHTPKATKARDLCDCVIKGFSSDGDGGFTKDIRDLLQAVPHGIAFMELIWEPRSFKVPGVSNTEWYVPVALEARNPEHFTFDPITGQLLIFQGTTGEASPAPPRKFIVYRPYREYEENWGTATLRPLLWLCWFARIMTAFWIKAAEQWGTPKLILVPEHQLTREKQDLMQEILDNQQAETGILTEPGMKPYFMEFAKNGDPSVYERFLQYKNEQVRLAFLGQTLTTAVDGEGGGSAVGEVHERRQASITSMDARSLEACINNTLLRWIIEVNMPSAVDVVPQLEIVTEPPKNKADIVNYYKTLCEINYNPSRQGLFDEIGAPIAREEEDELCIMPAAYAGAEAPPQNSAQRRNKQKNQPSQDRDRKRKQKQEERNRARPAENQPRPAPSPRNIRP